MSHLRKMSTTPRVVVLDMDSTEISVYGQQEHSSCNGH
jgi:hypothetical protein